MTTDANFNKHTGQPYGKSNYIVLEDDVVLAYCQKAGSSALLHHTGAIQKRRQVGQEWVQNNATEVILFMRDPFERLRSCYQFFYQNNMMPAQPRLREGASWEEFVDMVLDGDRRNPHWDPQTLYHTVEPDGPYLITATYPFELLNVVMKARFGVNLPKKNASEPMKLNMDYRIEELGELYAQDCIERAFCCL